MIQDPSDELLAAVRRAGDDPTDADRQAVRLLQRRFGLALPAPFAAIPPVGEPIPVRRAVAHDGPAIAAMKWRSWRVAYRGMLPDAYLDELPVRPAPGYWTGLATLPPSRHHGLFVGGRPGTVLGACKVRPVRDDDLDPAEVAEIEILYLDPLVRRRGLGGALLAAAVDHAHAQGTRDLSLWVAAANEPARRFYEAQGWRPDGAAQRVELGDGVAMDEVRYRLRAGDASPPDALSSLQEASG